MIRVLDLYVNADRSVSPRELKIANQFEIKSNEIVFHLKFPVEGNVYLLLVNQDGSFYVPLHDNKLLFDSSETWIHGGWVAHVMVSETEIIDGVVDKSKSLFISDDFGLWVEPSDIDINDLKEQKLPTPLKLLYDDLFELAKRTQEMLDNDWTGDPGKSAYEIAVDEGYQGSKEEWLNSLKGADGSPGKDGRSILSIEKTSSMGLIDTYTITYTDFTTTTFDVTNGASGGGGGGGGGGGSSEFTHMMLVSEMEDTTFTLAYGNPCELKFNYTSLYNGVPTGKGNLKVTVNGIQKINTSISQGSNTIDVGEYLAVGDNSVMLTTTDAYGTTRPLLFEVSTIKLSVESLFDPTIPYSDDLTIKITPYGNVEKTIYFEVDGSVKDTLTTSLNGKQITHVLTGFTHGAHILSIYATADVGDDHLESPALIYAFNYVVPGQTEAMIASTYSKKKIKQGELVSIPFIVYDPSSLNAEITQVIETSSEVFSTKTITVDRSQKYWNTRNYPIGNVTFTIYLGDVTVSYSIEVEENDIKIEAETNDLELYLTADGRSNDEDNPAVWTYKNISATFTGFNFKDNGWLSDDNGDTRLRINGDARLEIEYKPFSRDLRQFGKFIEIEFAVSEVARRDAIVISCLNGGLGIQATADTAYLRSEQSYVECNYKPDEKIRLGFGVQSRNENRFIQVYLNGVLSDIVQYPTTDNFQQNTPVNITFGSNDCAIDVYSIRSYNTAFSSESAITNFIADIPDLGNRMEKYEFNDIYDEFGNIVYSKAKTKTSTMVFIGDMPTVKGDKKTGYTRYDDIEDVKLSFLDSDVKDVQGTSSQFYPTKNIKLVFTKPHLIDESQMESTVFCIKVDFAEATGTHNTQNALIVESLYSEKIPPQLINPKVRSTIYGKPIIVFTQKDESSEPVFYAKGNFNFDKGSLEVFGFTPEWDVECWEFKNNTSDSCNFLGPIPDNWDDDFEARYPDKHKDISRFKIMHDWVVSTRDNPDKFKREFEQYFDMHFTLIYYVYTFFALMVDQRAKNLFLTYWGSTGKWYPYFYDNDTCFGINNEGKLVFDYYHEDTDKLGSANVFNGQNSLFWVNFRTCFSDKIQQTYQDLRREGKLTFDTVINQMVVEGSNKWPEAIYNEDAKVKYIDPENTTYLSEVRGTGEEHLMYIVDSRFHYCDSKWYAAEYADDFISLRIYTPDTWLTVPPKADITVTPYSHMYAGVRYKANGTLMQQRVAANQEVTFVAPNEVFNDTETAIYGASQLSSLGDLAPLYPGSVDTSKATKIKTLKVGDGTPGYANYNLIELSVGHNDMLEFIDVRNCPEFKSPLVLSECSRISEIYAEGSSITSVELPNSGYLKIMHLPETITNFTIKNQLFLQDLKIDGYSNILTLNIENCPTIDEYDILKKSVNLQRVRLTDVDWDLLTADTLVSLVESGVKGIDENGLNVDVPQVTGHCHITEMTGDDMQAIRAYFPYLEITYDTLTASIVYMNEDGTVELYRESVLNGGDSTYGGETPTKESTAQYNFTWSGWSTVIGGEADENATKNVETNRTVYASFTEELRSYTVRFLLDGTVLQSSVVPYGSMPEYTGEEPTKTDYKFTGWNPEISAVTGDVDYVAKMVSTKSMTRELIDGSVTSIESKSATKVRDYAFYDRSRITLVDLQIANNIGQTAFKNCRELSTLILRSNTMVSLSYSDALRNTAIANGTGYIYVPRSFLSDTDSTMDYRRATNWSTYSAQFRAIEDYPEICGGGN